MLRSGTLAVLLFMSAQAFPITKVGNGDDGSDLEHLTPVTEGAIIRARKKAARLLDKLSVPGIPGMGDLRPELNRSPLFLADKDVKATLPDESGSFHVSLTGSVYARTFARPYAATRFFPSALRLSEDQLVALHIHEALHRSLPETIRENESAVSDITLAITSPETSFDQIRETAQKWMPEEFAPKSKSAALEGGSAFISAEPDRFPQPSSVGYVYRQFVRPTKTGTDSIHSMHLIQSDLYPFGKRNIPFGFGLQLSYLKEENRSYMGPVMFSSKMRVWSVRDFEVGVWGSVSVNTLSAQETQNSPFSRTVAGLGILGRKDFSIFYIENTIGVYVPSEAKHKMNNIDYTYKYGSIVNAKLRGGFKWGMVDAGIFGELHSANEFSVSGGAFDEALGEFRLFSMGPEITMGTKDFSLGISARYLVDATPGTSYDLLGDIMGPGVAEGSVSASLRFFF